jgi:IS5 family transposase
LLKFRHLLEAHDLTRQIFGEVGAMLEERKLLMKEGTIVDATIIAAPSSTKNARKERDPEMHQTRKGNQWYFGMKAHLGVDAQSGLVHHVTGTAANVADIAQTHALLHGQEKEVYADAGYLGVEKRAEIATRSPGATWYVAAKRGQVKALAEGLVKELTVQFERRKAQVRARVEHPFHILKNLFRHRKTRYRGLAKNTAQLHSLFALANLFIARHRLLSTTAA